MQGTAADALLMSYSHRLEDSGSKISITETAVYEKDDPTLPTLLFKDTTRYPSTGGATLYIAINPISSSNNNDEGIVIYRAAPVETYMRVSDYSESRTYSSTSINARFLTLKVLFDVDAHPESASKLAEEVRKSWVVSRKQRRVDAVAWDDNNLLGMRSSFTDYHGQSKENICVAMDFLSFGSLRTIMKKTTSPAGGGFRDEYLILCALRSILTALDFLHNLNICHMEINAGHAYLCEVFHRGYYDDEPRRPVGYMFKICLGYAATLFEDGEDGDVSSTSPSFLPVRRVSDWAAAPEVYHGHQPYTQKADIWLVGITALELAYGGLRVDARETLDDFITEIQVMKKLPSRKDIIYEKGGVITVEVVKRLRAVNQERRSAGREDFSINKVTNLVKQYVKSKVMNLWLRQGEDLMVPLVSSPAATSTDDREAPFSEELTRIVMECLAWNPKLRPSVSTLLSYKFFRRNDAFEDGNYFHAKSISNPFMSSLFLK